MHQLSRILKWTFGALFIGLLILFVLGHYFKTFDFDIIDSGPHTESSQTREEAIERHTFVCDVKFPSNPYRVSGTRRLYLKSGWIEQSWVGGFWYWTTHIDHDDFYYNITLLCSKAKGDTTDWTIINKKVKLNRGYQQLGDLTYLGRINGTLDSLPVKHVLRYTVLKRDTIDFHESNIDGTLLMILGPYTPPEILK